VLYGAGGVGRNCAMCSGFHTILGKAGKVVRDVPKNPLFSLTAWIVRD
jgi:hypothetical protein